MRTPRPIVTILVIVALVAASALFVALAVAAPLGDPSSAGLRPWNVKFIVALVALAFLGFATLVLARAVGRRSDEKFARSVAADVVIPVYIYPSTVEQIRSAFPTEVVQLPSRAMLAADALGVTFWARPAVKCLSIPWSEISTIRPTEVGERRWDGIAIRLADDEHKVEVVLVGMRFLGRPSQQQALDVATELSAVRDRSG